MIKNQRLSVAVLMGGDSSERPVSFSSGRAVADALSSERYAVTCFDVSSYGALGERSRADAMGRRPRQAIFPVAWDHLVTTLQTTGFDVVVPMLHGGWGEDGTLQSLLAVAGLPFVGSPARACCIALDKPLAKAFGAGFGVRSPKGFFVNSIEEMEGQANFGPCVVKPARGGSSVGVSVLAEPTEEALRSAIVAALADGSGVLVEELIVGTETTCAVLGEGERARALPVIEIVPLKGEGWYDFEAKYAGGGSEHLIPARLPDEVQAAIRGQAEAMHRALGCRGVSRSDFMVTAEGVPYFLETNCLPGMTETSLVPDAARAAGMEFGALLEVLITDALGKAQG